MIHTLKKYLPSRINTDGGIGYTMHDMPQDKMAVIRDLVGWRMMS